MRSIFIARAAVPITSCESALRTVFADAQPNFTPANMAEESNESATSGSESADAQKGSTTLQKEYCDGDPRLEILCGITVAMALVPEAIAFALSSGLEPSIGLNSAWIIAMLTAICGGRPAMICGATGSIAVLIGDVVAEDGLPYLFCAVILMGIVEIILGVLQVGALVKLIPAPVMIGFCNGLALVIGLAQFNQFKDPDIFNVQALSTARRLGSFSAFTNGVPFLSGMRLVCAIMLTTIAFLVSVFLPKLTTRVPSALVAIFVGTLLEWTVVHLLLGSSTPTIQDIAALDGTLPSPVGFGTNELPPLTSETFGRVFPLSMTMAAVGLLESLMTLNLIDEITKTKGNTTRECIGQGIACIVCGVMGGMGGCAMIGQSMINVSSGARQRLSSLCAGAGLLAIVLVAYPLINLIPVSALVGVMFNVCYQTFEWSSLRLMLFAAMPSQMRERCFSEQASKQKIRRTDALVIFIVTLVTLFTDLATAVACGMLLSLLMFALESSELISATPRGQLEQRTGRRVKYYQINGVLFFGSTTRFLELFDEEQDPDEVCLLFDSGYIADYSAVEALNKLGERYGARGKSIRLQVLKPRSSKIIQNASGLLVKEITLQRDEEEERLPTHRQHLAVEQPTLGIHIGDFTGAHDRQADLAEESSSEESTD